MTLAAGARSDNSTSNRVKCGRQRCRADWNVVAGHPFDIAQAIGLRCLNRNLLVHAQCCDLVRWVQIQSHDIPHFLAEEGILRNLKVAWLVLLEMKDARDRTSGSVRRAGRSPPRYKGDRQTHKERVPNH